MKIAVVEFAGKGGLIHYAWQLCRAMHAQGADVTLVTDIHYELDALAAPFKVDRALRLWDPKPDERFLGSSVPRETPGAPEQPRYRGTARSKLRRLFRAAIYHREWLRLAAHLRELRPDVVQFGDIRFGTDLAPLAAARAAGRISADICHNIHPFSGDGTFGFSRFERALYSRVYAGFDAVFVHYASNIERFAATFPASASKAVPIIHGNEEIFRELASPQITPQTLRRELGLAENEPVVLFFGTISTYKGIDLLVDAFEHVREATLVLAGFPLGDVPQTTERVRVVPRYIESNAVAAWMEMADVVVFPYRNVFQSGALHVAQTFGAPIVATRVGAMPEVIRHRQTGLIVEPDDSGALAQAINELLADRALARSLGDAAAREAATDYAWANVANAILQTYEGLL